MADNALPSTDPNVATDDVAGVHYQRIKLVDGTLDGTDAIPGTAARGLSVDPRPKTSRVKVSTSGLTTATTAYVTGDQLGGQLEFPNAVRSAGASGVVLSAVLIDDAKVVGAVDLYLFDRSVTPAADNAAAAFSDADMQFCLGVLSFPAPEQTANNGVATIEASGLAIVPNATSLYGCLVAQAGHTFFGAADDLTVALVIAQD